MSDTFNASATGDPHITRFDGSTFDFMGTDGQTYHLFATDGIVAIARVAVITAAGESIFDRVMVEIPNHTAIVTLTDVTLDGVEPTAEQATPGGWAYTMAGPIGPWTYTVVTGADGGTICVHRHDGSTPDLIGTVLANRQHLQVFFNGPPAWTSATGVITQGTDGGDASRFAVTQQAS